MGKTYKRLCVGYHRTPRGRKQALIQGGRSKAVPPSSWDDISACDQAYLPYKLAGRFYDEGVPKEEAARKLKKKFRLKDWELSDALYMWDTTVPENYAQDAFDVLSDEEKLAVRLRYGDNLADWHNDFVTKYRGERNTP